MEEPTRITEIRQYVNTALNSDGCLESIQYLLEQYDHLKDQISSLESLLYHVRKLANETECTEAAFYAKVRNVIRAIDKYDNQKTISNLPELTEQFWRDQLDKYSIATYMKDSLVAYLLYGRPTGGFLRFVLENNLMEAFIRADNWNFNHMGDWSSILYNVVPGEAFGSPEQVENWIKQGGFRGKRGVK